MASVALDGAVDINIDTVVVNRPGFPASWHNCTLTWLPS